MNEIDALAAHIGNGGFGNPCEANHGQHKTKSINVGGQLEIFDWAKYANTVGYCPADDAVSQNLEKEQQWEVHVSQMAEKILGQENDGGIMVDIGAQIGWYTKLALDRMWPTVAVEANPECVRLLEMNAARHAGGVPYAICQKWLDDKVETYDGFAQIKLLKCDIEGAEQWAFKLFEGHFKAWQIDYAIMEISPVFNDSYTEMIRNLMGFGYTAYRIDQHGKHDRWTFDNLEEKLKEFTQVDMVFTSPLAETVIR